MSTDPTPTTSYLLAAEVEMLLRTKDDYLASNRSSAALSALRMLYEELQSSWQELTMPSEELELAHAEQSLQQKKDDWRHSMQAMRKNVKKSKESLTSKTDELTWNSEQLTSKSLARFNGEFSNNAKNIKRSKQKLAELQERLKGRRERSSQSRKEYGQTLKAAFNELQQTLEQQTQRKRQELTELQQSCESASASTTGYEDLRQSLTQKSNLLKQLWTEHETHEKVRNSLAQEQGKVLASLTDWKKKLEEQTECLREKQMTLVRAGYLSEAELSLIDFSELSAILAAIPR